MSEPKKLEGLCLWRIVDAETREVYRNHPLAPEEEKNCEDCAGCGVYLEGDLTILCNKYVRVKKWVTDNPIERPPQQASRH